MKAALLEDVLFMISHWIIFRMRKFSDNICRDKWDKFYVIYENWGPGVA